MRERIVSRNNPKVIAALAKSKGKSDFFLVEGYHLVEMAIASKMAVEIYSLDRYYPEANIPQYSVSLPVIEKMASSKTPEGIVALCKKKADASFDMDGDIIYLDDVQDPGNVGTLLRSALSFGCRNVYLSKRTAYAYSHKVLMASQGAIFKLNVEISDNDDVLDDVNRLRDLGYFLISTDLKDATQLREVKTLDRKFALILGNEGKGVDPRINKMSDMRIKIEMDGIDSLNVGVAGGILMYELCGRKGK